MTSEEMSLVRRVAREPQIIYEDEFLVVFDDGMILGKEYFAITPAQFFEIVLPPLRLCEMRLVEQIWDVD